MRDAVLRSGLILLCCSLAACTTTLSGYQSNTGMAAGASTSGHVSAGSARVSGSFGASTGANAAGGRMSLGPAGSALLVVGLVVVDAVRAAGSWVSGPASAPAAPTEGIAHTCSCYGYRPELTPARAAQ
jgi:hypothetical protein